MSVNVMPKLFRYSIIYNGITTVLTTDPNGWQEQSIGFTRSDDYGLNTEYTVPLSFAKQGYSMLKSIFESGGMFSKAYVKIEKRKDDWTYEQFYLYRLDFRTYKDNGYCIEIEGIEDGLLSLFSANVDTEYEINLPYNTDKNFLEYNGVLTRKTNQITCNFGQTTQTDEDNKKYRIKGTRAVRRYYDSCKFTSDSGEPFEHVMFQAVKNVTVSIRIKVDMKVYTPSTLNVLLAVIPATGGKLRLISRNADWSSVTTLWESGVSTNRTVNFWRSLTEEFSGYDVTANYTLSTSQPYIELIYVKDDDQAGDPNIESANGSYIEIAADTVSDYDGMKLEVFTHEWVIGELLKKIYPSSVLNYNISHDTSIPMLSCTGAIKNVGRTDYTATLKTSLKDMLKSLDVLCCIGIDISGNTFTIAPRADFYKNELGKRVKSNNIVLQFDDKHCYNSIKSGGKTLDKYENTCYPFNCVRNYAVQNTAVDNEYDLEHPFKIDQYSIEEYISNVQKSNSDSDSECEFVVFSCLPFMENQEAVKNNICGTYSYVANESINLVTEYRFPADRKYFYEIPCSLTGNYIDKKYNRTLSITKQHSGSYNLFCSVIFNATCANGLIEFDYSEFLPSVYKNVRVSQGAIDSDTFQFQIGATISLTDLYFNPLLKVVFHETVTDFQIQEFVFEVNNEYMVLDKLHTMTGMLGDADTSYNVAFTAKRLINKHLPYISISNWRNGTNKIKFISSEKTSDITSRLGSETADVVENADFDSVEPLFKPMIITFDTQEKYDTLTSGDDSKYKYIEVEDEKTGKVYKGWKNKATYAVGKNQTQSWELQAYDI